MADRVELTCPCCQTELVVDAATGEILSETRPKVDHQKTFEDAMGQVRSGASRRADAFAKAFDRTQNQEDLLQKKFEEAAKKAKDDKSPRRNPLDFD